jgi:hypothetical protein
MGSAMGGTPMRVAGSGTGSGSSAPTEHVPVKLTPELAAIKFELLPNWKRDVVEGGSFSLSVDPPSGGAAKVFTFHYGYEDPGAPIFDDPHGQGTRDQYLKWLGDSGTLQQRFNRQSGAAWYIEGSDAAGAPSFRVVINYGGKHLICYGGLYKDPDSSRLGDIRDEVVNQARKICESLGL